MSEPLRRRTKDLLAHIPGALETALAVNLALRRPPAPGRPGQAFHSWLRDLAAAPLLPDPPPERRVLLFACRNNWLRMAAASAVVLLHRNCRVDVAYLPYHQTRREETLAEAKQFRYFWGRYLRDGLHPRLHFTDLSRVEPAPLPVALVEQADSLSILDARWCLQLEEIDAAANPQHRAVWEFRRRRNLDGMARLLSFLRSRSYDVAALPHGNVRELGAAFRVARHAGLPTVTYDFKERAEAIVLSDDDPVAFMDTSREWNADAPHTLSPEARERVRDLIARRCDAQWKGFSWSHQYVGYEGDRAGVLTRLDLPAGGPVALLCPNVAWDSSLQGRDRAFSSLVDWVRHTARFFADRPQGRLVIRVHPSESMFGTAQPVAQVVRDCFPRLPANLRIVDSQDAINTYDLMDLCDFGLVYNSTTGLEFALRGTPVLVAGRPHYSEKGFTREAGSREQYDAALDGLLESSSSRLSDRQIELAWCYADVFFFRWHHPFPWCMSTFWKDLERWPLSRVLSPEGQARFGPTFDILAGRRTEPRP